LHPFFLFPFFIYFAIFFLSVSSAPFSFWSIPLSNFFLIFSRLYYFPEHAFFFFFISFCFPGHFTPPSSSLTLVCSKAICTIPFFNFRRFQGHLQ
jgi:hypothetical protein